MNKSIVVPVVLGICLVVLSACWVDSTPNRMRASAVVTTADAKARQTDEETRGRSIVNDIAQSLGLIKIEEEKAASQDRVRTQHEWNLNWATLAKTIRWPLAVGLGSLVALVLVGAGFFIAGKLATKPIVDAVDHVVDKIEEVSDHLTQPRPAYNQRGFLAQIGNAPWKIFKGEDALLADHAESANLRTAQVLAVEAAANVVRSQQDTERHREAMALMGSIVNQIGRRRHRVQSEVLPALREERE